MTLRLTAASFLNGVRSSGLVEPEPLDVVVRELRQCGADGNDSRLIAEELVKRDLVTSWQAEKLLLGRHKGFFLGRYRLLRLLGTGQMSAVYLGRHVLMDHLCAIKVLPADKVGDTSYLGRFYREAKAVAALNHPNVIRAYDVDKQVEAGTEIHFLVLEYVEGTLLTNLIQEPKDHHVDLITAADVIRQAAEGLSHAHAVNMVHRDIKPDNLLLTVNGQVKILDLGLARFFKTTDEESLTLKHDERVIGTADYLAPEQAIDSHSVDSRADIYGLGCTFYCALTGHPPFTEGTLVQRLMAHQNQLAPPVTNDRPDVPESLVRILDRMLAKKASDRYQTARELADDLTAWLLNNASDEWKERHLPIYAALRLLNMIGVKPTAREDGDSAALPLASGLRIPSAIRAKIVDGTISPATSTKLASSIPRNSTVAVALKAKTSVPPKPADTVKMTGADSAKGPALKATRHAGTCEAVATKPAIKATAAKPSGASRGPWNLAERYPVVTIVVSIVAAVLLVTAGVILFRPSDSAAVKDRGRSSAAPTRTVQAEIAPTKCWPC